MGETHGGAKCQNRMFVKWHMQIIARRRQDKIRWRRSYLLVTFTDWKNSYMIKFFLKKGRHLHRVAIEGTGETINS